MTTVATRPFSVCVYCGSRHGSDPAFTEAARTLGRLIAERGWRLVYGGGRVGLMGEVADAALAAGGSVLGVIPQRLEAREVGHTGLTELVVVPTMHARKQAMAEAADAFIALPGGLGTLEELFEVWTWRHLGYHDQPIGLLNVGGFYDLLLGFLQQTEASGFVDAGQQALLQVQADPQALLSQIAAASVISTRREDFSRI
ncbi:TIGR00730 family Rossman fold protein [Ideonella azotifigens]|uniref:LOG family protein n=1 Tax=Ideonella azotifigens TaxID=513160 RepID=UPI00114180F6|nr:TIGR00730 family Rossman fold protein [Ideonella azotifigens]MCD2344645.1 TIGR00730 family Rossman fold protein [Ideonella azotifigens]